MYATRSYKFNLDIGLETPANLIHIYVKRIHGQLRLFWRMEHLAKHPGEKFKNIIKQQVQLSGASDKRRQLTKFKDVNASLKLVLSSRSGVQAFIFSPNFKSFRKMKQIKALPIYSENKSPRKSLYIRQITFTIRYLKRREIP